MERPIITDDCVDAVVKQVLYWLPSMDSDDLSAFVGAILREIERKKRRTLEEERSRWMAMIGAAGDVN